MVCSGAGAAAISCLDLWCDLGIRKQNVTVCDSKGVIFVGRDAKMDETKARYAQETAHRTLADAIVGADIFLGLSTAGVLKPEMVKTMADKPIIFALSNPTPEIMPELAKEARPDAIIATGRSDYPNQVNNVPLLPVYFPRRARCGATRITEEMKLACVRAIAAMAQEEVSDEVAMAYAGQELSFGPEYLIPEALRPTPDYHHRPGGRQAAAESGVATRPIADMAAYKDKLKEFIYHTGVGMRAVFTAAEAGCAEAHHLHRGRGRAGAARGADHPEERLAKPVLIGRPDVIAMRLEKIGRNCASASIWKWSTRIRTTATRHAGRPITRRWRHGVTVEIAKMRLRQGPHHHRRRAA